MLNNNEEERRNVRGLYKNTPTNRIGRYIWKDF